MNNLNSKTYFAGENKDIVVVKLSGYIDQTNSYELERLIKEIKDSKKYKIIFDCSEIVYISSAGWGIIVGEVKGLREKGGDIKITNMNPEVYEVFQMLEFYHILEDFGSVEEAVASFEGKLENVPVGDKFAEEEVVPASEEPQVVESESIEIDPSLLNAHSGNDSGSTEMLYDVQLDQEAAEKTPGEFVFKKEPKLDISKLPVHEKVKKVIENYPLLSIFQIRKMLRHDEFGKEKIGLLRLYRILREMNLHTKKLRYRYYRSC